MDRLDYCRFHCPKNFECIGIDGIDMFCCWSLLRGVWAGVFLFFNPKAYQIVQLQELFVFCTVVQCRT